MIWLLHFDTNRPPDSLLIDLMNVRRTTQIFFYDSESETEVYPDENYRGRLHCNPRLARKGRLECLLTDVRLNDTGTYDCVIVLNRESSYKTCDLNVKGKTTSPSPLLVSRTITRQERNILTWIIKGYPISVFLTLRDIFPALSQSKNKWIKRINKCVISGWENSQTVY